MGLLLLLAILIPYCPGSSVSGELVSVHELCIPVCLLASFCCNHNYNIKNEEVLVERGNQQYMTCQLKTTLF